MRFYISYDDEKTDVGITNALSRIIKTLPPTSLHLWQLIIGRGFHFTYPYLYVKMPPGYNSYSFFSEVS